MKHKLATRDHCRCCAGRSGLPATVACASRSPALVERRPAKKAIVEFVEKVTTEGSPDFVPPAERIATFDNDGTLWAEQPMYFQSSSRSTA